MGLSSDGKQRPHMGNIGHTWRFIVLGDMMKDKERSYS